MREKEAFRAFSKLISARAGVTVAIISPFSVDWANTVCRSLELHVMKTRIVKYEI